MRLASVSFDPANDTPEKHARAARDDGAEDATGRFLCRERSGRARARCSRDYGQDATPLENGSFRHVLKIFLVDDQLRVRNVYSAGLLDPELVIADVDTVTGSRCSLPGACRIRIRFADALARSVAGRE